MPNLTFYGSMIFIEFNMVYPSVAVLIKAYFLI